MVTKQVEVIVIRDVGHRVIILHDIPCSITTEKPR